MLSYAFTEEQEDLRQMVREFAQGEIAPLVEEAEAQRAVPGCEVIPMLGELGLLGIVFPEEYGGIGADQDPPECIFVEEMAKVCAGITASVNAHADLAAFPIYKFGTDAQRERYLPRSIAGEIIGAYAITEPDAGSDAAGLASRAEKKNGGYVINGRKNFVANRDDLRLLPGRFLPALDLLRKPRAKDERDRRHDEEKRENPILHFRPP